MEFFKNAEKKGLVKKIGEFAEGGSICWFESTLWYTKNQSYYTVTECYNAGEDFPCEREIEHTSPEMAIEYQKFRFEGLCWGGPEFVFNDELFRDSNSKYKKEFIDFCWRARKAINKLTYGDFLCDFKKAAKFLYTNMVLTAQ